MVLYYTGIQKSRLERKRNVRGYIERVNFDYDDSNNTPHTTQQEVPLGSTVIGINIPNR